jgi:cytochrome b561
MAHAPSRFSTHTSYDTRTIALHWLSAALVLGLWIVGQTIDFFPSGTARIMARSMHIALGAILGVLLVLRLAWRRNGGVKFAADPGLQGRAAVGVHHLLYLLLVAIVVIGLACVWIRGDNLFNLVKVPAFDPANKALRHDAVELRMPLQRCGTSGC